LAKTAGGLYPVDFYGNEMTTTTKTKLEVCCFRSKIDSEFQPVFLQGDEFCVASVVLCRLARVASVVSSTHNIVKIIQILA
jgi:hypothetical protein